MFVSCVEKPILDVLAPMRCKTWHSDLKAGCFKWQGLNFEVGTVAGLTCLLISLQLLHLQD